MKKYKNKILAGVIIAVLLVVAFYLGGDVCVLESGANEVVQDQSRETQLQVTADETEDMSVLTEFAKKDKPETEQKVQDIHVKQAGEVTAEENKPQSTDTIPITTTEKEALSERTINENQAAADVRDSDKEYSEYKETVNETPGKGEVFEKSVAKINEPDVKFEETTVPAKEHTCILSVRCDTILNNISRLDSAKVGIVPKDGVIFAEKAVTFYEGESVFNVLVREMKRNKIHLEFEMSPAYETAYIEGIANIYEFDCGEFSGWLYKVNNKSANVGCSMYKLKDGDKIEWIYTCG